MLPYKIFASINDVKSVVMETSTGSYGLLPHRQDCLAALVPGILSYETEGKMHYVAIDEGVMIKAGSAVTLSVRNAVGGKSLGQLGGFIKSDFNNKNEKERAAKTVIARLERGFVYSFDKFRNH